MIKRIVVPVDFSNTSLQALDYAVDFGRPFKAEIVVVHVIEPIYFTSPTDMYVPSFNTGMLLDEQRRIGREQLASLAADLKKRRINARTILQTGSAHQVITDTAKRVKADLIVMATHGRTGLSHVVLGSVAERVVRHAECPVLTVRGSKRRKAKR